ncbi:MAG: MFS transporter [Candidatus Nanopelagicales bacterium]|nr:MFS transporter [Candidatus Nanopelagicales bacterium]MCF8539186.1 MFS transporter [Candidatus Nanopelagicales bacterium]
MGSLWQLRHFKKLLSARTISNIGNGIAPIALAFGVLDLPGATPTSLSIVLAAQAVPLVVLLPIGGVVADKWGRARVIAASDILLSFVVMTVAVLFLTGTATVAILAALGVIMGVLNAFFYPAMSALTPEVVPEEHLQPANGYIAMAQNGGMIAGSAIGGILVATVGSGIAIAIDALTFFVAGLLVFSFRHVSTKSESSETMITDLVHGWRVFTSYRWIVVIVAAFSLIVMVWRGSEEVMGPVLALEIYDGAAGWSVVLASQAIGLLVGAFLGTRINPRRPLVFGMLVTLAMPLLMFTLAFQSPLWIVASAAFLTGVSIDIFYVVWITAIQRKVPRESLSRVMSYDAFGSLILGPIGLALAGPLIATVGAQLAFGLFGLIALAAILASLLFRSVRSVTNAVEVVPEPQT